MNLKHLPEDLKEAIFSEKTFEFLQRIWIEFHLNDTQQEELGSETGRYLSGMTLTEDFVPNLMERLDINPSTAVAIKERIDTEIIAPIRASFEYAQKNDLHSEDTEGAEEAVPVNAVSEEDAPNSGGIDMLPQDNSQDINETPLNNPEKSEIMQGIENPLNKNIPKETADDSYSNYSPLNVLKDDVLKGIEDPQMNSQSNPENREATELDLELDAILKKPRIVPEMTRDLPTDIPENIPRFGNERTIPEPISPKATSAPIQNPRPQNIPVPQPKVRTAYAKNDPYREPIE